jgi:hypothetical protein
MPGPEEGITSSFTPPEMLNKGKAAFERTN